MSLSLEQAQWLVQFMQNLPGADREYEDATHAQRVQAAHGLNVQQHVQPEHTGYVEYAGYAEGEFEAGYAEAPYYDDGYDSGYESY
jgi:hypothetical protein